MAFNVGDRVVIVKSPYAHRIGTVAMVLSDAYPVVWTDGREGLGHNLNLDTVRSDASGVAYPPEWLELYRPDHNEKAEWSEELKRLCKVGEDA